MKINSRRAFTEKTLKISAKWINKLYLLNPEENNGFVHSPLPVCLIVDEPGLLFSHSETIEEKTEESKEEGRVRTHTYMQTHIKITSCQRPNLLYDCFFTWRLAPGIKVSYTQQKFGDNRPDTQKKNNKKTPFPP